MVIRLEKENYKINLVSCPVIKPLAENFIVKNIKSKKVLCIEENSEINGLGYFVSNCLIKNKVKSINLKNIALKDIVHNKIGTQEYLRDLNNLSVDKLYAKTKEFIKYGK